MVVINRPSAGFHMLLVVLALLHTVQPAKGKKHPVRLEDIVIAFPADVAHLTVAKASRIWRKGIMRTFIAHSDPPPQEVIEEAAMNNETWSWYPDDKPKRSLYPGDSRAGLVPFLAHRHFGDSYKWLLYMDDDTIFFPDAVIRLLEEFDPDMPYFISDHLWWPHPEGTFPGEGLHPSKSAPRCLPCHFNESEYLGMNMSFPAPKGCPCTPELLCKAAPQAFNEYCDIPRFPEAIYSMHGGAGGMMSVGLMRAVSLEFMEKCTQSLHSTGGDAFITICLWQAGYAITDPGKSLFYPDLQYFDPGPEDRLGAMQLLSRATDGVKCDYNFHLECPKCDESCQLKLESMVSIHVRSRMFRFLDDAAAFIKFISIMYETYAQMRQRHQEALVAAAQPVVVEEEEHSKVVADMVLGEEERRKKAQKAKIKQKAEELQNAADRAAEELKAVVEGD